MKTSKKLLSLFLAIVMVITSCSVGLTAFAADKNKTDSNNNYWHDGTDAEEAFSALNDLVDTYVPELLNIDAIKSLLEDSLGMTITDTTTISDVIAGVSPMMLGLLGSSGDKASVLGSSDGLTDLYYSYLDDEDAAMDFFALYQFCKQNKNKSGEIGEYASETFPKLEALLNVYSDAVDSNDAIYNSSISYMGVFVGFLMALFDDEESEFDISDLTPEFINKYEIPCESLIEYVNDAEDMTDDVIECISDYCTEGKETLAISELDDDYSTYLINYINAIMSIDADSEEVTSFAEALYYMLFFITEGYPDEMTYHIYKGLAELGSDDENFQFPAYEDWAADGELHDAVGNDYYYEMVMGSIIYSKNATKKDVEALQITKEQVEQLCRNAYEQKLMGANEFIDWLKSNSTFSSEATNYILDDRNNVAKFINPLQANKGATTEDEKEAAIKKNYDTIMSLANTGECSNFDGMTYIEQVNYMVPSVYASSNIDKNMSALEGLKKSFDFTGLYSQLITFYTFIEPETSKHSYDYNEYAIPDSLIVEATNSTLDSLLGSFLDPTSEIGAFVAPIISALTETEINLWSNDGKGVLNDLWLNLYNQPVETLFNLMPTLIVLVDELIVPLVLNGYGDLYNNNGEGGPIFALLASDESGILYNYSQAAGSEIGIGSLTFDLNTILPSILHWIVGDEATAIDLVEKYYKDIKNVEAYYDEPYDSDVLRFTNIYIADKAIQGARIGTYDVTVPGLSRTLYNSFAKDATDTVALKEAERNAIGIDEMVTEIATFAMEAVDEYLELYGEDERYNADYGSDVTVTQKGLNNIMVALPKLIDIFGKKFIEKYNVDSDWTYTYDGKFETITKSFRNGVVYQDVNATLQEFKDLASLNDPNAVLDDFVDILIGNWLNGALDFINDIVADENNKISANLPLVQSLLSALGGFGEQSIITDLVNGLFQLKRSDVASFTLTERETTGFVGFSNESGFFLLSNIQFTKDGESRGLVPVIMELINGSGKSNDYNAGNAFATATSSSPLLAKSSKSDAGTDYSKLLSTENEKAAQDIIDTLDKLLSSLLSNTSLNGFDWDATDNILASVATFFSAYFGAQNTNDLIKLLNNYLYYIVGENNGTVSSAGNIGTKPSADGDVDASKVYTSANLSNLVIQTYSFIENVVDYLFYNSESGLLKNSDSNMLIADAVAGLISPDAVAVRMSDDYSKTAEILLKDDYLNWNSFKVEISTANAKENGNYMKDYLKFGFKNGDKDAFYDALGETLSGIAGLVSTVLTATYTDADKSGNLYSVLIYPLFNSMAEATGASAVMTPSAFNAATPSEQLINGILAPIASLLDTFYKTPVSSLINLIKGLAGILNDKSVKEIVSGVLGIVNTAIGGAGNIVSFLSPTFGTLVSNLLGEGGLTYEGLGLPSKNVVVYLINSLLSGLFVLPNINWNKLANAENAAQVFLLTYGYLVDTVLNSDLVLGMIDLLLPELTPIIKNLSATEILDIINDVIASVQNPSEVYWTFSEYASKLSNKFSYPNGITSSDAEDAISDLDSLIANIFPLLQSLGILDIDNLGQLVSDNLYTNSILTSMATGIYGALADGGVMQEVFKQLGIDVTPAGFASYLTNSKYGTTYSSAASTLKKAKSWKNVKSLNWGFKDGSANAQKGFINGLAAVLRPFNDLVAIFLAEGSLDLTTIDIKNIVNSLDFSGKSTIGEGELSCKFTYKMKKSVLTLTFDSNVKGRDNKATVPSVLKIDLNEVIDELDNIIDENGKFHLGTNGYESVVVPFLEAFMCDNVKTYSQYKSDYKKAKDNLLIDVLNPVFAFVDDVLEAPIDTLTSVLPNVAYFIDGNGISQLIGNLLAPITADDGLLGVLAKHGLDIDKLIPALLGDDLGTMIADLIGVDVDFTLELRHLETCNIQDLLIPLVNMLLEDMGLTIPDIDFGKLASLGTLKTVKSAAKNSKGSYTTKQVTANQGQVLVTVLRYISELLIDNSKALSKLLCSIDDIKKDDMISGIIKSVFNQIGIATPDEIVIALFYFFQEETSNVFFDYSNFTFDDSFEFSFGNMDEDFCRQLGPMLDGLVNGLLEGGLLGLIEGELYKDEIITSLAVGLYGAIDTVNISDSLTLTSLLAQTGIDFSTTNVANLLVDEAYGQQYQAAASVIKSAGSWSKVNKDKLVWGVKDRDSFMHALVAVLRPIYGVLDVLLNDASLNLFNLIRLPGSDGYTSTIVPLLEAFSCYNIKTQYQYREDIFNEYDNVLLDIINPLWDKVEDICLAPIETLGEMLPTLSLFFANDGLLQIIDNLLEAVSALIKAVEPVANINDILVAAGLNIPELLGSLGIKLDIDFDIYDLQATLEPVLGSKNVVNLLNQVIGLIDLGGTKLNLVLPEINWYQLASHGELVVDEASQAATIGKRIYVDADPDETLIAVLRYLIDTVNYENNYDTIVNLISGLLGDSVDDSMAATISDVLGMLKGDSDTVIESLVELLQSFA